MEVQATKTTKTEFKSKDIKELKESIHGIIKENPSPVYSTFSMGYLEDLEALAYKIGKKESYNASEVNAGIVIIYFYCLPRLTSLKVEDDNIANIARSYLNEKGFSEQVAEEILSGIKNIGNYSSHFSNAISLAQDVLTVHYGKKGLKSHIENEFKEFDIRSKENTDKIQWIEQYVKKIKNHRYNTKRAKKKYHKRKLKNLDKLKLYTYKLKREASLTYNKRAMTMFKTASRNQVDLVNIADKKAGIMITVNAILLTIMLPLFASYIIDMSAFFIPAVILVATCGISIVLATLATKPINKKEPSKEDFLSGNRSLFYFRNFNTLDKEEYRHAIQELIVRDAPFENAVITDLYDLGVTLGEKYKRLKWCYLVFAVGITLTVVSLLLCIFFVGY